jgi:hypothetical protein
MSEQPKPTAVPERTYQDIQNQYTALCNKAGHLNYSIDTHNKDLKIIYEQLRSLNFEAAALQAKQQAKEAQEAADKAQAAVKKEALESSAPGEPVSAPELPPVAKKPRKLKEVKANA